MTGESKASSSQSAAAVQLWPWLLIQVVLTTALQWWQRDVLNHDAIAYLRIAEYYAGWDTAHMISGYWGPLFSWLIAVGLKFGLPVELAARMVMVMSATVFLSGGVALLRHARLSRSLKSLSLALFAVCGALWSAQNLTPDLLMAGLALWAIAFAGSLDSGSKVNRPMWAGVFWGLAYLAKPIALPWAGLVLGSRMLIERFRNDANWKRSLLTGAVALLVASPWVLAISAKYGRFTISTSGPIAHAIAGPADEPRYHPGFVTLHTPEAGRTTSWEDPTRLPYRPWSPFASLANARHQLWIVAGNILCVLFIVTTLIPPWPCAAIRAWRVGVTSAAVIQYLLPVGLLGALYLPFYLTANEQRYFFAAVPLIWMAWVTLRTAEQATSGKPTGNRAMLWGAAFVVLFAVASMARFGYPPRTASSEARKLATWLQEQETVGPVAGSALQRGGRTGLFLAWYLDQPWLGDDPAAAANDFANSGARIVVLSAQDPRVDAFAGNPRLRELKLPTDLAPHVRAFAVVAWR